MKENIFENKTQNLIEKSANYEGNDSLLFYERLNNSEIKKKLVDTILEYQETASIPSHVFEGDRMIEVDPDKWVREIQTREEIEKDLEQRIHNVFLMTNLEYDKNGSSHAGGEYEGGTVAFCSNNFNSENDQKCTTKQLSIIEAHEKGHGVRPLNFPGKSFKEKLKSGFDFSNFELDPILKRELLKNISLSKSEDDSNFLKEEHLDYLMEPTELMERMSQLKNYFGMKGNEKFTKEHLDYARKNYLKDTGVGVQMKGFLDAITPQTEDKFLELINNLGI